MPSTKPRVSASSSEESSDEQEIDSSEPLDIDYNYKDFWNMRKLFEELATNEQCIQFAEERRLIPKQTICNIHNKPMSLVTGTEGPFGSFQCRKSTCRNQTVPRAKGTWFEHVDMDLDIFFHLMYSFSYQYPLELAQWETQRVNRGFLSESTVEEWYSKCNQAIVQYEKENKNKIQLPNQLGKYKRK